MRVMLDAHNAVRCGEETRVIPRLLAMRATWSRSVKERIRLDEAGVTDQVLDSAVRAFLLEVGWCGFRETTYAHVRMLIVEGVFQL